MSSEVKQHVILPHTLLSTTTVIFNSLSPHDALKHHFTSLKTDFISLKQRVLERKFP